MDKSGKERQANEASNRSNQQIQGSKTIPRTLLRIPITHICLKKMKNSSYTVMGIGITVRGQAQEAIKDVGRAVRVHKWQVNREINLRFFEIKDEGLTTLGPHVSGHLHQIKKLSFDFIWCGTISDRAVEMVISEPVRHLKQLKTLFLNFYACGQITDNGINILMSNITNYLPNINQLFLRLQACRQITDRGLEILSVGLARRLTQLDQLYLDFSWCTQITDKGLEILGSQIANMKQLRYLKLSFQATSQITDKGAEALGLGIATGPTQLKKLELDFFNTLLTQEMVQELKNILSFVVDLRIDSQY